MRQQPVRRVVRAERRRGRRPAARPRHGRPLRGLPHPGGPGGLRPRPHAVPPPRRRPRGPRPDRPRPGARGRPGARAGPRGALPRLRPARPHPRGLGPGRAAGRADRLRPRPRSGPRCRAGGSTPTEASVRAALPGGRIDSDVVHGHVGTYGGWVAVQLARPGARVFVTEHATFLDRILAQPAARAMYGQVIDRCTTFFCVSEVLRGKVVTAFPQHEAKVVVVPNAVAVERIPMRPRPVSELRRWLYLGRLLEHKGVRRLLESFAVCALDDPDLELTMVGGGRLLPELRDRAAALGLADRVHLPGPVPHEQVVDLLHDSDLLVHLSTYETFGMTVVEAVASGLPVLVTRSGGPEETLAGVEHLAGATVAVEGGTVEVVRAYRELVRRLPALDLPAAREVMAARYGQQAVATQLMAHYTGTPGATATREVPQP
ncbi:glycosyltransferase [Aquipuribacter sp. MA13-6]|uniref:glycosyltransferase n=1 Tax=Aquipuribacter sp. MA13-6 TaxID=3440839 RepID=UPI003EEAB2BB